MSGENVSLRVLLQRAGLSPEQLARQLNRKAAEMGLPYRMDQKTPYKWFHGVVPRFPWPTLVPAFLSARLGFEVSAADIGWVTGKEDALCVPADSGLLVPWTAKGALSAANNVMYNGVMERRFFLSLSGGALTTPALAWLTARPVDDIAGIASGRRVGDAHVDCIEQITAQLRRMDDQFGGGTIVGCVNAQVRFVIDVLRNSNYTSSVGKRLYAAAAEALRLAGWVSFDAGSQPQAQRYWLAGLHAAHASGDKAVGANILGVMSCQAKDLGLHGEAVQLAEAARSGYSGATPRVATIVHLRAAAAYAHTQQDVRLCRDAIDSAQESFRQTPSDDEPDWIYWLDEAMVNSFIGHCYMNLGNWKEAERHLRTAIRMHATSDARDRTLGEIELALTYAAQREPERACQTASKAVDSLTEGVHSGRCVSHLKRVQAALKPYRKVPAVTDFNDQVSKLLSAA